MSKGLGPEFQKSLLVRMIKSQGINKTRHGVKIENLPLEKLVKLARKILMK